MPETYDLIVLGGGRASNLAMAAARAGWKTALIERDRLGGACPNRGCVPSKLLVGFAAAAQHVRQARGHFIEAELRQVNQRAAFASINEYVDGVDGRYAQRLEASGATLIRGEGRFIGPMTVGVGDRELTAERIVIATGSRPVAPPFPHLPVWTSDSLFPLRDAPPKSLLVVGGGFIGCEMAAAFAALGTATRLITRGDRLLGREDRELEQVFQTEFEKAVPTQCQAKLTALEHDGRQFQASFTVQDREERVTVERVLFAIGRAPNSEALDLGNTGLTADARGFVPVNDHLETSVPGIYATGDVNGRYMLQHAAAHEVYYLRQKLLKGVTDPIDERLVAHAVFSHPEVASVGLTEAQLEAAGTPYVAVFEDWLASARVMGLRIEYPRTKLLVSPTDYSILGCHLVGPEAATLLHQVLILMRLKNDVRELAEMIYIHPALNECLLAAAVKAVSEVKRHRQRRAGSSDASA